jgi:ATP-dependent RNA helicase RhlE
VVELEHSAPASTIEHVLYRVTQLQKVDLLLHLLDQENFGAGIVFCRTKHRAKRLADQLIRGGHSAIALQGNMTQPQRDKAMGGFRSGRYDVLVATDIAARGIDVAELSHVINFDVPTTPDYYTHRIGRTGRSERQGTAYTFVAAEDYALIHQIERRIKMKIPRLDPPAFERRPQADAAPAETLRRQPARKTSKPAPKAEAAPAPRERERTADGPPRRKRRRRPGGGSGEAPRSASTSAPSPSSQRPRRQAAAKPEQGAGERRRSRSGRRRVRKTEPSA